MQTSKTALALACAAMLTSCGGGGGATANAPTPTPSSTAPTPTPSVAQCSLSDRQDWTLAQLEEWYLFPNLFNASANPASYGTVQDYIDALVKPARDASVDRYFTYITSIEEENAFFEQGATAGFGIRLGYDTSANRVFVIEAFEDAPALGQNVDRGTELLSIGTSEATLQTVSSLMLTGGPFAVIDALGPDTPGTSRTFIVRDSGGVERTLTLVKADYAIDPVSDRYGFKIVDDGGKKVGYLNLRTFIDTAATDLRTAFQAFQAAGVTELVIDLRYNGGGLISVAALMGDLMGKDHAGEVFSTIAFRDSKSFENEDYLFVPRAASIQPTKIAFIATGSSASASEMLINGMQPYLASDSMALIGENTYGKPVGQIALDRAACDDRLRVLAFKVENADGLGEYYEGLADTVPNTCRALDDISEQLGDPNEAMLATALDFLAGRSCTAIAGVTETATASATPIPVRTPTRATREILQRERPNTVQRNVPGIF